MTTPETGRICPVHARATHSTLIDIGSVIVAGVLAVAAFITAAAGEFPTSVRVTLVAAAAALAAVAVVMPWFVGERMADVVIAVEECSACNLSSTEGTE